MLREGAGVAVEGGAAGPARPREAVGELGAATLEQLDPVGRLEPAAERELQREGAVVGRAGRVAQQLGEELREVLDDMGDGDKGNSGGSK